MFCMLFRKEFHDASELKEQTVFYMESLEDMAEEDKAYLEHKLEAIYANLERIDRILDEVSSGWRLNRMGRVDLTLLRLAVYEMNYDDEVPVRVAINEAVDIAKKYGEDQSPAFINGILARLTKEDRKEDAEH